MWRRLGRPTWSYSNAGTERALNRTHAIVRRVGTLAAATWDDIERLRTAVVVGQPRSLEAAAQGFVTAFAGAFMDAALVRIFAVMPFSDVPEPERIFAHSAGGHHPRFSERTRVLTLLGTAGHEPTWNDRRASRGHLCIPLLDRSFVESAPMIAKLLADIDVDLAGFDDGRPIATRKLLGGNNGMFYVQDASTAKDVQGRHIIADKAFVKKHGIRTVFGMGGAYLEGVLVLSIIFSTVEVPRIVVDRFPSLIVNFKMATAALVQKGSAFEPAAQSGALVV